MAHRSRTHTPQHKMVDVNRTEFEFHNKTEGMEWYQRIDASERYFSTFKPTKILFRLHPGAIPIRFSILS